MAGRASGVDPSDMTSRLRRRFISAIRRELDMATARVAEVNGHEVLLTRDGYERLREQLRALRTTARREASERLREARSQGGELAENPELADALEDQALLEQRIRKLAMQLALARVVDPVDDGTAGVGTCVRLRHSESGGTLEYELVGSLEADPAQRRISVDSPVGEALVGRRAGDTVEVRAPRGRIRFALLSVRVGGTADVVAAAA
jgi:transcription elongation factor GreA